MEYLKDYFGFVYIWHDTKYSRFIIGSHLGSTEDGYTTSTGGKHVQRMFTKRPETLKRRVLQYCIENDLELLHRLEQKWLNLRPNIAGNQQYYNQKQWAKGGIDKTVYRYKPLHWIMGHSDRQKELVKQNKHNFNSENTTAWANTRVKEGTHHFLTSDFNKKPFEIYLNGTLLGKFDSKVDAVKRGIKAGIIDKLKKHSKYVVERGSYVKSSTDELYVFKKNDILEYKQV